MNANQIVPDNDAKKTQKSSHAEKNEGLSQITPTMKKRLLRERETYLKMPTALIRDKSMKLNRGQKELFLLLCGNCTRNGYIIWDRAAADSAARRSSCNADTIRKYVRYMARNECVPITLFTDWRGRTLLIAGKSLGQMQTELNHLMERRDEEIQYLSAYERVMAQGYNMDISYDDADDNQHMANEDDHTADKDCSDRHKSQDASEDLVEGPTNMDPGSCRSADTRLDGQENFAGNTDVFQDHVENGQEVKQLSPSAAEKNPLNPISTEMPITIPIRESIKESTTTSTISVAPVVAVESVVDSASPTLADENLLALAERLVAKLNASHTEAFDILAELVVQGFSPMEITSVMEAAVIVTTSKLSNGIRTTPCHYLKGVIAKKVLEARDKATSQNGPGNGGPASAPAPTSTVKQLSQEQLDKSRIKTPGEERKPEFNAAPDRQEWINREIKKQYTSRDKAYDNDNPAQRELVAAAALNSWLRHDGLLPKQDADKDASP